MKKIKLADELYSKTKEYAEKNGYSSVEEFVSHVLSEVTSKDDAAAAGDDAVAERLKGLGYIS